VVLAESSPDDRVASGITAFDFLYLSAEVG
jgi:hypothetical protein